eukprot:UN04368
MVASLLPFQKEGLGWMFDQEKSDSQGGILADQMGMGKTIQTIALLVEGKNNNRSGKPQTTLIVCPSSNNKFWSLRWALVICVEWIWSNSNHIRKIKNVSLCVYFSPAR